MKYGILTFHNIPNTGAALQAYALCRAVREKGADCEIIDYRCDNIIKRERTFHRNNNPMKSALLRLAAWPKTEKKIRDTDAFMASAGMVGAEIYDHSCVCKMNDRYDAFITGSDMIWNLHITDRDYTYFLDFAGPEKKKFAYAPSVDEDWTGEQKRKIQPLLRKYDKIGVRELDTQRYFENELGIKCSFVSDPTMLISPEKWRKLAVLPKVKDYVLVYFPEPALLGEARKYAQRHGKKLLVLNWGWPIRHVVNVSPSSPQEWMGYIVNAGAVFTNSYHGFLFSLYFEKPVWTAKTGTRLSSVMEYLDLKNRFICAETDYEQTFDYKRCGQKISELREKSLMFLDGILYAGGTAHE